MLCDMLVKVGEVVLDYSFGPLARKKTKLSKKPWARSGYGCLPQTQTSLKKRHSSR